MEIKYLNWVVFTKCNLEPGIMSHRCRFIFTATENFSCGKKRVLTATHFAQYISGYAFKIISIIMIVIFINKYIKQSYLQSRSGDVTSTTHQSLINDLWLPQIMGKERKEKKKPVGSCFPVLKHAVAYKGHLVPFRHFLLSIHPSWLSIYNYNSPSTLKLWVTIDIKDVHQQLEVSIDSNKCLPIILICRKVAKEELSQMTLLNYHSNYLCLAEISKSTTKKKKTKTKKTAEIPTQMWQFLSASRINAK